MQIFFELLLLLGKYYKICRSIFLICMSFCNLKFEHFCYQSSFVNELVCLDRILSECYLFMDSCIFRYYLSSFKFIHNITMTFFLPLCFPICIILEHLIQFPSFHNYFIEDLVWSFYVICGLYSFVHFICEDYFYSESF